MISSILTSLIVAGITYLILYKCCSVICEEKHMSYDDLVKEYQVSGLLRIVLDTFKIVFDFVNNMILRYQNNNFVKKTIYRFLFQIDFPEKPILKFDKIRDREILFNYLIELLEGNIGGSRTINFKHLIENIWQNKWSFFGYSSYISDILRDIGDICYNNKLPIIIFLITYNDGTISNVCFQEKWKNGENGWFEAEMENGIKIDNEKFKVYVEKMITKKEEYKKILEKIKKSH